jgi:hypothetical protein
MRNPVRTRAQWAARINATHKAVVASCFGEFRKLGRELLAAKEGRQRLPHGEFLQMIQNDLTIGERAAQMLMRVVRDKRLAPNAKLASYLPKAVTVLHELTKASDEAIERGISDGTINPQMTRAAAKKYLTVTITDKTERIVAPYHVPTKSEQRAPTRLHVVPAEEAPLGFLEKLERLEQLATDLMEMQQHGIDADSEKRIRAVAENLLSLIARHEAPAAMRLQYQPSGGGSSQPLQR